MNSSIPLPNKVYFIQEEKYKSKVVIEPLYPGYGVTIGNALRRVLLSSLPGSAVTAVKIKAVDHEFSIVPSITEDVVDIILNLKQLRLKLNSDQPARLELKAKGQKEVRAKDIKPDSRAEIFNPDLLIATLDNKNSDFQMEIIVEQGRGYVPVEMREGEKLEIGMIAVDAIFTPMRNVNFEVQNVRVGQITNYDKLTVSMETDGTITGREALDIASEILVEHFSLLKTSQLPEGLEEKPEEVEPSIAVSAEESEAEDISGLGLSKRAQNALFKNHVRTLEELKKLSREDLNKFEGLGAKSVDEIVNTLSKLG